MSRLLGLLLFNAGTAYDLLKGEFGDVGRGKIAAAGGGFLLWVTGWLETELARSMQTEGGR